MRGRFCGRNCYIKTMVEPSHPSQSALRVEGSIVALAWIGGGELPKSGHRRLLGQAKP